MAEETLKETVGKVVEETKETSTPNPAETEKGSTTEGVDTKSGETTEPKKEYVRGIDISNIPEADRERLVPLLEEKLSLVDKGNQEAREKLNKEKSELQDLIQTRDYLAQRGITTEEVNFAIDNLMHKKTHPQEIAKTSKLLDKLIEQAPIEQRPNLEQFRTIVREETGVQGIRDEVKALRDTLGAIKVGAAQNATARLTTELEQLSTSYGELVDKYRVNVLAHANNPQARGVSAEQLLFMTATPQEIKTALSAKKSPSKVVTEKKNAVSNQPSGVNAIEQIDVKKHTHKSLLKALIRNK